MKHRFAILLVALVIMIGLPVSASADDLDQVSTEVSCTAESIYNFSSPPDAALINPSGEILIGQFTVNELLLKSGEWLTISLNASPLLLQNNTLTLAYAVACNPPLAITAANNKENYDVTVTIDANVYADAAPGIYSGQIQFLAISHPSGDLVYQGTTAFTVQKSWSPTGNARNVSAFAAAAAPVTRPSAVPAQSSVQTIPSQTIPQAPPSVSGSAIPAPGEIIPEQLIPQAAPAIVSWALLNLILAIATAVAAIVLLIGYFTGKKKKEVYGEDEKSLKRRGIARLISLIPGIGGIVAFMLTETIPGTMGFTDQWTLLMIVIAAAQVLVAFLAIKKHKDESHYAKA